MSSAEFQEMAVKTCSLKQLSSMDNSGKRGEASTIESGLKCLPLDPVSEEIREDIGLNKPYQALQTFIELSSLDIREKDIIEVDGIEYVVRAVGNWMWDSDTDTVRLILEDARVINA